MADIWHILKRGLTANALSPEQLRQLIEWERADARRAIAWGITEQTAEEAIALRFSWLRRVTTILSCLPLPSTRLAVILPHLWQLWLPLALQLKQAHGQLGRPLIQGILGGQGIGKTTLCQILHILLAEMGLQAVSISIDDIYKTYAERQRLRQVDPRLIWRGPPGTHDIELGQQTLIQLREAGPDCSVAIPRFDKSLCGGEGDRVEPERVKNIDVVLFEGWFVGVHPIDAAAFECPPPPIDTEADREFALAINQQLHSYQPLWALLDRLMALYPWDYRLSQQWRRQAEHAMKATGKSGMDDASIDQFVRYFWQAIHPELFLPALIKDSEKTDLVVEIQANRSLGSVYCP